MRYSRWGNLLWCGHPISELWLKYRMLDFQTCFLPMHLGTQQKTARVLGTLPSMREAQTGVLAPAFYLEKHLDGWWEVIGVTAVPIPCLQCKIYKWNWTERMQSAAPSVHCGSVTPSCAKRGRYQTSGECLGVHNPIGVLLENSSATGGRDGVWEPVNAAQTFSLFPTQPSVPRAKTPPPLSLWLGSGSADLERPASIWEQSSSLYFRLRLMPQKCTLMEKAFFSPFIFILAFFF